MEGNSEDLECKEQNDNNKKTRLNDIGSVKEEADKINKRNYEQNGVNDRSNKVDRQICKNIADE
eukprot:4542530-Heterocapsa_arctica.AAC.1